MKIDLSSSEMSVVLASFLGAHEKASRNEGLLSAERSKVIRLEDETFELKRQVDSLKAELAEPARSPAFNPDWMLRELAPIFGAATTGQKIQAIKMVRELTGCGLKEAKDCVEGSYGGSFSGAIR